MFRERYFADNDAMNYGKMVDTPEECREYCNSEPKCLAWEMSRGGNCGLNTIVKPDPRPLTGFISGFCNRKPEREPDTQCGEVNVDQKIEDTDPDDSENPRSTTTASAEECRNQCQIYEGCVGWNFRPDSDICDRMIHVKQKLVSGNGFKSGFCTRKSVLPITKTPINTTSYCFIVS
ncbi:unnamed protein product [Adineta steineri]|uniref:Apple domain-containing protein n=1 Tax=Adineta steineri TaxID=433720 RepID=A0A814YLT4_9BILA|nr:unnamed protein product [Adineta steineri]CAF1522220.1 unnamed protein product [Adineta steineri]